MLKAMMAWEKGGRKGMPPLRASLPPATAAALSAQSAAPRIFHLMTRQEQAPNPSSRVTLGTEKDAMGMPRVKLDWQLTDLDKHSIRTYYELLGREMGRSGVGRVQLRDW